MGHAHAAHPIVVCNPNRWGHAHDTGRIPQHAAQFRIVEVHQLISSCNQQPTTPSRAGALCPWRKADVQPYVQSRGKIRLNLPYHFFPCPLWLALGLQPLVPGGLSNDSQPANRHPWTAQSLPVKSPPSTPRLKEGGYLTSNGNPREPSEA